MALDPQQYDQIVQTAWRECQQQQPQQQAGGPAGEAGRAGGQRMGGNQASAFARQLLNGLQQAGVTDINEALSCARQGGQRQA